MTHRIKHVRNVPVSPIERPPNYGGDRYRMEDYQP
jgi:hypothetical protein